MSMKRWAARAALAAVLSASPGAWAWTARRVDELRLMDSDRLLLEALFICKHGAAVLSGMHSEMTDYLERVALVAGEQARWWWQAKGQTPTWYTRFLVPTAVGAAAECDAVYREFGGK